MDDLERRALAQGRQRALRGAVQIGAGGFMLATALPEVRRDLLDSMDPDENAQAALLRLREHGSLLVAGAAETVAGGARIGSQFTSTLAGQTRLLALTKWSGRLGAAAGVAGFGFVVWQYHSGVITERQFYTHTTTFGAGIAGGTAGAWGGAIAGASIGTMIWPGAGTTVGGIAGGIIGGLSGGYAAGSVANYGMGAYFQFKDHKQEKLFVEFLYDY